MRSSPHGLLELVPTERIVTAPKDRSCDTSTVSTTPDLRRAEIASRGTKAPMSGRETSLEMTTVPPEFLTESDPSSITSMVSPSRHKLTICSHSVGSSRLTITRTESSSVSDNNSSLRGSSKRSSDLTVSLKGSSTISGGVPTENTPMSRTRSKGARIAKAGMANPQTLQRSSSKLQ